MADSQVRFGKNPSPWWKKQGLKFPHVSPGPGGASWSASTRVRAFPFIPQQDEDTAVSQLELADGHTSAVDNTNSLSHFGSTVKQHT